jgi:CBS domain-containing protein
MQTRRSLGEVVALQKWPGPSGESLQWLGRLMSEEGMDITEATADQLERGSAVYATVDADVVEVQRLMAQHHILRLPVVDGARLVGIVDLIELALRASQAGPEPPSAASGP